MPAVAAMTGVALDFYEPHEDTTGRTHGMRRLLPGLDRRRSGHADPPTEARVKHAVPSSVVRYRTDAAKWWGAPSGSLARRLMRNVAPIDVPAADALEDVGGAL
jgi:hypothetical protein